MNNKLLLIIFASIFLISVVQADVGITLFYDSTEENTLSITDGESFGIMFSINSLGIEENYMDYEVEISKDGFFQYLYQPTRIYEEHYSDSQEFEDWAYRGPGTYTITASVTGSSGDMETRELELIILPITPPNHLPVITSTPDSEIEEMEFYSYEIIATDEDDDELSYSLVQAPSWITLDENIISGTSPEVDSSQQYVVTINVSDGKDFILDTFTIDVLDVQEVNHVPEILSMPITEVEEGEEYSYEISAEDYENDELIYNIVHTFGWLELNENVLSGIAPEVDEDTDYEIILRVSDGGGYDTQSFTLTVLDTIVENVAPVAYDLEYLTYVETSVTILFNASDANEDNLEYEIFSNPENGVLELDGNGLTIYTPNPGFVGMDSFEYRAFDGQEYSNVAEVIIGIVDEPDTTAPQIKIASPREGEEIDSDEVLFEIAVSEDAVAVFVLNGEKHSMEKTGAIHKAMLTLENGDYEVTFYVIDLAGNIASKSINFSVNYIIDDGNDDDDEDQTDDESNGIHHFIGGYYDSGDADLFFHDEIIANGPSIRKQKTSDLNWYLIVIILFLLINLFLILLIRRIMANRNYGETPVYEPNEPLY